MWVALLLVANAVAQSAEPEIPIKLSADGHVDLPNIVLHSKQGLTTDGVRLIWSTDDYVRSSAVTILWACTAADADPLRQGSRETFIRAIAKYQAPDDILDADHAATEEYLRVTWTSEGQSAPRLLEHALQVAREPLRQLTDEELDIVTSDLANHHRMAPVDNWGRRYRVLAPLIFTAGHPHAELPGPLWAPTRTSVDALTRAVWLCTSRGVVVVGAGPRSSEPAIDAIFDRNPAPRTVQALVHPGAAAELEGTTPRQADSLHDAGIRTLTANVPRPTGLIAWPIPGEPGGAHDRAMLLNIVLNMRLRLTERHGCGVVNSSAGGAILCAVEMDTADEAGTELRVLERQVQRRPRRREIEQALRLALLQVLTSTEVRTAHASNRTVFLARAHAFAAERWPTQPHSEQMSRFVRAKTQVPAYAKRWLRTRPAATVLLIPESRPPEP